MILQGVSKMKQFFTEKENDMLNESHHGRLRFTLFKGEEKVKTFYRVTISGGLSYANSLVADEQKDESTYTIRIFDRKKCARVGLERNRIYTKNV